MKEKRRDEEAERIGKSIFEKVLSYSMARGMAAEQKKEDYISLCISRLNVSPEF